MLYFSISKKALLAYELIMNNKFASRNMTYYVSISLRKHITMILLAFL